VDNIILAGNDSQACKEFKEYLNSCFCIKDLGLFKYFLGIEVTRGPLGLFLCQRKYALQIVDDCGQLGSKLVDFSIEENHKLALAMGKFIDDPSRYRHLIYLTITQLELCYAVHILS